MAALTLRVCLCSGIMEHICCTDFCKKGPLEQICDLHYYEYIYTDWHTNKISVLSLEQTQGAMKVAVRCHCLSTDTLRVKDLMSSFSLKFVHPSYNSILVAFNSNMSLEKCTEVLFHPLKCSTAH